MSAETKLFLVALAVLVLGLALIAAGLGLTTKLAMVGTGIALTAVTTCLLAAQWRSRR